MFFGFDTLELRKTRPGDAVNRFTGRIGNKVEMYANFTDSLKWESEGQTGDNSGHLEFSRIHAHCLGYHPGLTPAGI
jgi:hypothetical protein